MSNVSWVISPTLSSKAIVPITLSTKAVRASLAVAGVEGLQLVNKPKAMQAVAERMDEGYAHLGETKCKCNKYTNHFHEFGRKVQNECAHCLN